jgi:hypothetical protein
MFGKRATLVLAAALAVTACGGGASPGTGTQPPASRAPTTAPAGGGGGGATLGTLNVDVGGVKRTYAIQTCVDTDQGLAVVAALDSLDANGAALLMPHDSSAPSISGVIDGTPWVIAGNPKGTLNGKSGTFSGTDMASDKQVTGDFACTN